MKKAYKLLRPGEVTLEELLTALNEGRLILDTSERIDEEKLKNDVRAYVQRISCLVTPKFKDSVDSIWDKILSDDEFIELLKPGNKTRKRCDFNKYGLMGIICVLREKGVYQDKSQRRYDALLEPESVDSPYRKYLGKGLERPFILKIRKIMEELNI